MYHYGIANLEMVPMGTFETLEEALEAAQRVSMERDEILVVWHSRDDANPEYLCWGGSVYRS
jgi:hypothetical protein